MAKRFSLRHYSVSDCEEKAAGFRNLHLLMQVRFITDYDSKLNESLRLQRESYDFYVRRILDSNGIPHDPEKWNDADKAILTERLAAIATLGGRC
jgi:hypothetical protein